MERTNNVVDETTEYSDDPFYEKSTATTNGDTKTYDNSIESTVDGGSSRPFCDRYFENDYPSRRYRGSRTYIYNLIAAVTEIDRSCRVPSDTSYDKRDISSTVDKARYARLLFQSDFNDSRDPFILV